MRAFDLTIRNLVDENFIYARALSYLGVDFYLYPDRKLADVCAELRLEKSQVMKAFYLFDRSHRFSFRELNTYPLEVVIEYLRHSHHLFIKDRLPFIARIIGHYPEAEDLKLIFPEFVEEFINHIYEEEDTVFSYIEQLLAVHKTKCANPAVAFWKYRNVSLAQIHAEHSEEDELEGIRNLVEETISNSLHWQVIVKEIKSFDREMWYHAEIENKILFPKAIALESHVREKLTELSRFN